jgi:hypothetical protein
VSQADPNLVALAVDFDGTIATDGRVDAATLRALHRWRGSGRLLVLVTGRLLQNVIGDDGIAPLLERAGLFDLVICEGGAVAYDPHAPADERVTALSPRIDDATFGILNVAVRRHLERGYAIAAAKRPDDIILSAVIQTFRLPLEIELNLDSVTVAPRGVTKGTGFAWAAERLRLDPCQFAGAGDARNDLPFLDMCGFSVAPAQAERVVKRHCHATMRGIAGAAISEAIDLIIADDIGRPAARMRNVA